MLIRLKRSLKKKKRLSSKVQGGRLMKFVTYKLIPCAGCNEQGIVKLVSPTGVGLGTCPCPSCKSSPKPGYILQKVEEEVG